MNTITPEVRAITNLSTAFGKKLAPDRIAYYASKLEKWKLSEPAWSRIVSRLVSDLDNFPSLSQLIPYLRSAKRGGGTVGDIEPVWETWRDSSGRTYAKATGEFRSLVPSDATIAQWKREACPTSEGQRVFLEAFVKTGGDLKRFDEFQFALRR